MIEFQKEYLNIIQQQNNKYIISESVIDSAFSFFADLIPSTDSILGNSQEQAQTNIKNIIDKTIGKFSTFSQPITNINNKGKKLQKGITKPYQAAGEGKNVDEEIQKSAEKSADWSQAVVVKEFQKKARSQGLKFKGLSKEALNTPQLIKQKRQLILQYKNDLSKHIKKLIIQDAKRGITPNMWFDSSAKPENQKPIIFEDITYNFKTNNGKIICEEIQNKTKKRHLICESVIKEANATALTNALIYGVTNFGSKIFKNKASMISKSMSLKLNRLGIDIKEGTSCEEALKEIQKYPNDGTINKKECLSVFVNEKDIKFIEGTIGDEQDFNSDSAEKAGSGKYSLHKQWEALHSKSTNKQVRDARKYADAAIEKSKQTESFKGPGGSTPPPAGNSASPTGGGTPPPADGATPPADDVTPPPADGATPPADAATPPAGGSGTIKDKLKLMWTKIKQGIDAFVRFIGRIVLAVISFIMTLMWFLIRLVIEGAKAIAKIFGKGGGGSFKGWNACKADVDRLLGVNKALSERIAGYLSLVLVGGAIMVMTLSSSNSDKENEQIVKHLDNDLTLIADFQV